MARLSRVSPAGVTQHIIQRGNNRQACFKDDEDMKAYIGWLEDFSARYDIDVHAWVLLKNHVHILCTPHKEDAVSKMMQSIGRMYVRYFNLKYKRSGTLWEGRFKACLVQSDKYLIDVCRYIDTKAVREKKAKAAKDYSWSSYSSNALGEASKLQTPHKEYNKLGKSKAERIKTYKKLADTALGADLIKQITDTVNKGMALGDAEFTTEIESTTNKRVTPRKAGRPRKNPEEAAKDKKKTAKKSTAKSTKAKTKAKPKTTAKKSASKAKTSTKKKATTKKASVKKTVTKKKVAKKPVAKKVKLTKKKVAKKPASKPVTIKPETKKTETKKPAPKKKVNNPNDSFDPNFFDPNRGY